MSKKEQKRAKSTIASANGKEAVENNEHGDALWDEQSEERIHGLMAVEIKAHEWITAWSREAQKLLHVFLDALEAVKGEYETLAVGMPSANIPPITTHEDACLTTAGLGVPSRIWTLEIRVECILPDEIRNCPQPGVAAGVAALQKMPGYLVECVSHQHSIEETVIHITFAVCGPAGVAEW